MAQMDWQTEGISEQMLMYWQVLRMVGFCVKRQAKRRPERAKSLEKAQMTWTSSFLGSSLMMLAKEM